MKCWYLCVILCSFTKSLSMLIWMLGKDVEDERKNVEDETPI
jgi:hypothetical protein